MVIFKCGKTLLDLFPIYLGKQKYEALAEKIFSLEIVKRESMMSTEPGSIRMEVEEEQKKDDSGQNYPNNQIKFFNS